MNEKELQGKILIAAKWSTITEIAAKILLPIINMILARILVPEAFGIVATVTMITTFIEMFADVGFQKYLVQYEFKDEKEKFNNANVAFWTNFSVAIIFIIGIFLFREQIAELVGNKGYGNVIALAALQLPLTSFSSIQMALFRREFDFKTLFFVRVTAIIVQFIIVIPLAMTGFSYWSIIIGNISLQLVNAVFLTIKSKWKPTFLFKFEILKKMTSFSLWTLAESISIWFTMWIDAFIIGTLLSQYYLGLYRTSITMVNALMALITGSVVPILFSGLSRLQNDENKFNYLFFKAQRIIAIVVMPLGVGVFLFSDLVTGVMLGEQWNEASKIIGIWSLTSAVMIVFSHFSSEVYRAKGLPKLSLLSQLLHLLFLVPTIIYSSKYGFWVLVYARSLIRFQGVLVNIIFMKYIIQISIIKTFKNVMPIIIASLSMGILGYILKEVGKSVWWTLIVIVLCCIFYFSIIMISQKLRHEIINLLNKFIPVSIKLKLKSISNFKKI